MSKPSPKEMWVWGVFAGLHAAAVGALVLSQGCGTPRPPAVEPPPAPVMPPPAVPEPPPAVLPPPAPVPPAVHRPTPPPAADVMPSEYVVQPGESLSKIAAKHGVSTRELAELNHITDPNKLRAGQKLKLPVAAKPSEPAPAARREMPPPPEPAPAAAVPALPLPAPARESTPPPDPALTPTPPVTPPPPAAPTPTLSSAAQPIRYPVGAGETLDSIAKIFLVTPESILKLNNLPDASAVKPGMTLLIPISP